MYTRLCFSVCSIIARELFIFSIFAAKISSELLTFMYIIHTLVFCDLHLNFTAHMNLMVHRVLIFKIIIILLSLVIIIVYLFQQFKTRTGFKINFTS